ncbi:hypothetical protein [Phenylobacterium sp.]|uniref:hypothetical protein n=1 Tax=Phenylobacterium sp. TaxID=1871053 RepID=UPI002811B9EA|nr:hypothetical protein [Phenylobacterium sp.]
MIALTSNSNRRSFAFRIGVVAGFAGPLLLGLAMLLAPRMLAAGPLAFDFLLEVRGADASLHGVTQVSVDDVVQTCRGRCDDLRIEAKVYGDGPGRRLTVLDNTGRCLICTDEGYATRHHGLSAAGWRVEGRDRLVARYGWFAAPSSDRAPEWRFDDELGLPSS